MENWNTYHASKTTSLKPSTAGHYRAQEKIIQNILR